MQGWSEVPAGCKVRLRVDNVSLALSLHRRAQAAYTGAKQLVADSLSGSREPRPRVAWVQAAGGVVHFLTNPFRSALIQVRRAPPAGRRLLAEAGGVRTRACAHARAARSTDSELCYHSWRGSSSKTRSPFKPSRPAFFRLGTPTQDAGGAALAAGELVAAGGRRYPDRVGFSKGAAAPVLSKVRASWVEANAARNCKATCATAHVNTYARTRRVPASEPAHSNTTRAPGLHAWPQVDVLIVEPIAPGRRSDLADIATHLGLGSLRDAERVAPALAERQVYV